jgi:hypothetical protein
MYPMMVQNCGHKGHLTLMTARKIFVFNLLMVLAATGAFASTYIAEAPDGGIWTVDGYPHAAPQGSCADSTLAAT